ncbi:MAG: glycosyltransferase family 4 protein [Cryobacterium sp.]|nr:glycosyltransferase family 4 protein [Cryobacterium sp.]
MTRVLVITGDPIGARMAGPAIRAWNMADILSRDHEVILVTTTRLEKDLAIEDPIGFKLKAVKPGENREFSALERWAEVIVFQGHALDQFAQLRTTDRYLVADIYDPMHLEMLEQGRELGDATWRLRVETAARVLNDQMAMADFMVCASERQRLFYLGQLAALGRINPATYAEDPDLRDLLDVAPFGLPDDSPLHDQQVVKGVIDGIAKDDRLLIWGGGLYSWFDPQTLIRAVAALADRGRNVRLFFLGTKHPGVEEMGIVGESRKLAEQLGALDHSVFFNPNWVPYAERQSYLAEADAGVSTHHVHLETTFSFRTRILDYLWADLPMVVTEGDGFADLVASEGLGIVVPGEDPKALEGAIERVLFDDEFAAACRAAVARVRVQFTWDRVLAPLVRYVANPHHAADLKASRGSEFRDAIGLTAGGRQLKPYGAGHNLRMFWHYLRADGIGSAFRKAARRVRGNQRPK